MSVVLGETYKDTITGCKGVATARSEYLSGCTRILVELLKDGDVIERWFDESRLEGQGLPVAKPDPGGPDPGGPGAVAPNRDPNR